jgi:phosphohistidine phosphatase
VPAPCHRSPLKNLLILRHGSPAPKGEDGADFTRPLLPKGEQEARAQGGFLREAGIVPDLVATSTAVRAVTTAELLVGCLHRTPPVRREEALYNAPGEVLLDFVQRLPETAGTVLLVAHMPGVAELLALLGSDPADMAVNFSPCTLVGVSLGSVARWSETVPGCGVVEWLLPPLFAA